LRPFAFHQEITGRNLLRCCIDRAGQTIKALDRPDNIPSKLFVLPQRPMCFSLMRELIPNIPYPDIGRNNPHPKQMGKKVIESFLPYPVA
jgi:hypothetical protein